MLVRVANEYISPPWIAIFSNPQRRARHATVILNFPWCAVRFFFYVKCIPCLIRLGNTTLKTITTKTQGLKKAEISPNVHCLFSLLNEHAKGSSTDRGWRVTYCPLEAAANMATCGCLSWCQFKWHYQDTFLSHPLCESSSPQNKHPIEASPRTYQQITKTWQQYYFNTYHSTYTG